MLEYFFIKTSATSFNYTITNQNIFTFFDNYHIIEAGGVLIPVRNILIYLLH